MSSGNTFDWYDTLHCSECDEHACRLHYPDLQPTRSQIDRSQYDVDWIYESEQQNCIMCSEEKGRCDHHRLTILNPYYCPDCKVEYCQTHVNNCIVTEEDDADDFAAYISDILRGFADGKHQWDTPTSTFATETIPFLISALGTKNCLRKKKMIQSLNQRNMMTKDCEGHYVYSTVHVPVASRLVVYSRKWPSLYSAILKLPIHTFETLNDAECCK